MRKNKRARSLRKKLTGDVGLRAIAEGWRTVLKLRWNIEPGDSITFDCTSGKPEQQFRAFNTGEDIIVTGCMTKIN